MNIEEVLSWLASFLESAPATTAVGNVLATASNAVHAAVAGDGTVPATMVTSLNEHSGGALAEATLAVAAAAPLAETIATDVGAGQAAADITAVAAEAPVVEEVAEAAASDVEKSVSEAEVSPPPAS